MAKLYPECSPEEDILEPKQETIDFLLSYSKALRVVKCKSLTFDTLLN